MNTCEFLTSLDNTEIKEHDRIKTMAIRLLFELGCRPVMVEFNLPNTNYVIDVAGYLQKQLFLVECGDLAHRGKEFWDAVSDNGNVTLYIFPYNCSKPFLAHFS